LLLLLVPDDGARVYRRATTKGFDERRECNE